MPFPYRYGYRRSGRRFARWEVTTKVPGSLEWQGLTTAITEAGAKNIIRRLKADDRRIDRKKRAAVKEI
jgi:hypothetical protein